jgi:hypothetical protein
MLPVPPSEPAYVLRMRARLREAIEERRRVERECFRLRVELARVTAKIRRRTKV